MANTYEQLCDQMWLMAADEIGVDIRTCTKDEFDQVVEMIMMGLWHSIRRMQERGEEKEIKATK